MKKLIIILFWLISISLNARILYVASTGGDDARTATQASNIATPWATWKKAFATAVAGDTVYFRGGVYNITSSSNYAVVSNSGTAGNPICFFNYPGEVPILDCIGVATPPMYTRVVYAYNNKNYLNFRGLTVRNLQSPTGASLVVYHVEHCHDIHIENCVAHNIEGHGFELDDGTEYYIKNCDAYNLCDSNYADPGEGGSGFYAGTSVAAYGSGMYNAKIYFEGCRVWDFSDNGFSGTGQGYHEYKNCWAFSGGQMGGEGNGFKMNWGTDGDIVNPLSRLYVNCIAACNGSKGFNPNNNNYAVYNGHYYNNFSYHNGYKHYLLDWESNWGDGFIIYNYTGSTPAPNEMYANNIAYANEHSPISVSDNYTHQYNTWDHSPSVTVTNADFVSLDTLQLRGARQADSSLPVITFGHLVLGSDLIDKGINVGLPYSGTAPDLGYAEYGQLPLVTSITVSAGGITTITVEDGTLQLYTNVLPINAGDTSIIWSVIDGTGHAIINSTGLVTAQTDGTVTACATANDGSGIYDYYGVTLSNQTPTPGVGLPTVVTSDITSYSAYLAYLANNVITDDGGGTITDKGLAWGTSANPTIAGDHAHCGTGTATFSYTITGLTGNTLYYVRAFAVNTEGIAYGDNVSFTTTNDKIIFNGTKIIIDNDGKIIVIK